MANTDTPRRIIFACLDHVPFGVVPLPYDDGRATCSACGATNYAVRPFYVPDRGADTYWRAGDGTVIRVRTTEEDDL